MSVADVHAKIGEIDAERMRLEGLRGRWDAFTKARDAAAALRSTLAPLKELTAACVDATKGLLRASAETFEARVQRYLPERWTFKLRLVDPENPEREVFEVALTVDGVGKGYTSGTQRDALMAAIAQSAPEAKERVREFLAGRGPKVKKA